MLYMERLTPKPLIFQHIVVLLLSHSFQGPSEALATPPPVVALVGEDVLLPCRLEPVADAVSMIVEWGRPDLKPRFVHLWHEGQDLLANQNPSYKGRTSMFADKLKQGDLSLALFKVRLSDSGIYRCLIPKTKKESTVELIVGSVSSPVIAEIDLSGDKDVLWCRSEGWYPEPEVLWLDSEGKPLSAGPQETTTSSQGLLTVSKRVAVEKRNDNSFTCRIQQKNINQTRETRIHVSAEMNMSSSAARIIIVLAAAFCVVAVCFFLWKKHPPKTGNTELKGSTEEDECTEQEHQPLTETPQNETQAVDPSEIQRMNMELLEGQKKTLDTLEEQKKNLGSLIQELKIQEEALETCVEETNRKLESAKRVVEYDKVKGNFYLIDIIHFARKQLQERKRGDSRLISKAQLLLHKADVLQANLRTKMVPEEKRGDLSQENQSAAGV